MGPPLVSLEKLTKQFKGKKGIFIAVDHIDLTIQEGEIFSLLGPNGAGKTTAISMMSGLLSITSGSAMIGGFSIEKQPMQAKQLLGVVPQEIALYLRFTARQNLEFFGKLYGMGGKSLHTRIDEVLEFIDLIDRQHDPIETFSGGMKRRVNIGVGLMHKPKLVYMDEPTVGIDPQNRRRILDTVFRLRDEYRMTVLYTTHLMEEAQELSDRVGIIDHGKIIAQGTVRELTEQVGEGDRITLTLQTKHIAPTLIQQLQTQFVGVSKVEQETATTTTGEEVAQLIVTAANGRNTLAELIALLNQHQQHVSAVSVKEPNLEDVFLGITGRALRD